MESSSGVAGGTYCPVAGMHGMHMVQLACEVQLLLNSRADTALLSNGAHAMRLSSPQLACMMARYMSTNWAEGGPFLHHSSCTPGGRVGRLG